MSSRARARPRTNAEWSEATTQALTRRARDEFATRGYAAASLDRIAERAKVTKGAIYYHFGDKQSLFEVVFRDVERELVQRIDERATLASNPVDAVVAGCVAFLQIAVDDALRQIALVDGPAVLGWSRWRAIDAEFGLGSLKDGLRACQSAGLLRDADLDVVAHLVSGALNEAVFVIAESDDRKSAYQAVARTWTPVLRRMLGTPAQQAIDRREARARSRRASPSPGPRG